MTIKTLLISAVITFTACGLSFFYFKNRIRKTEQKVDLMFNLIQEHQKTTQMQQMQAHAMREPELVEKNESEQSDVNHNVLSSLNGVDMTNVIVNNAMEADTDNVTLIDVSDNDDEYSSDSASSDSEHESEYSDDDTPKLLISTADADATNDIASISLSGAETSKHKIGDIDIEDIVAVSNVDADTNADANTVSDAEVDTTTNSKVIELGDGAVDNLDTIELSDEDNKVEKKLNSLQSSSINDTATKKTQSDEDENNDNDFTTPTPTPLASTEKASTSKETSTKNTFKLTENGKFDLLTNSAKKPSHEVLDVVEKSSKSKQSILQDYAKMNMQQLRSMANERGLANYKGLRKPQLVELLSTST